jgi:hypothetical protein
MKTFEMYFSGPSKPDPRIPFAPTPEEMYNDFKDVMEGSGYTTTTSRIKQFQRNSMTYIEVCGTKP